MEAYSFVHLTYYVHMYFNLRRHCDGERWVSIFGSTLLTGQDLDDTRVYGSFAAHKLLIRQFPWLSQGPAEHKFIF